MEITPKEGLLLIKKHKNTKLSADIAVEESEDDKSLYTGEVVSSGPMNGKTVIFGRYALLKLTLKGVDYYLLDEEDIVGECSYKEE
jgi:co-chaperonin GroES (HSP10)